MNIVRNMNEAIRQSLLSSISILASLEVDLDKCIDEINHNGRIVREGSRYVFADFAEELGISRQIGRHFGGRRVPKMPEYWRFPQHNAIENRFNNEKYRIFSILNSMSIVVGKKKIEDGKLQAGLLETELSGGTLKQRIKATIRFLKKTAKKNLVYTKDISQLIESKPARKTQISEHISIAKKNIENPEVAINHIRTAISLLIQKKFGFDVVNMQRFVRICEGFGVVLPRNLISVYDLGSKNIHRGLAPSSSDIKAAIIFVEEFEKELNGLSISEIKLNDMIERCKKENVLFTEKR